MMEGSVFLPLPEGYTGQIRTVYRFIQTLKQEANSLPPPSVLDRVSIRQALWLMVRPQTSLREEERIDLEILCQLSSKLSALYTLVQDFGQMVRQREAYRFFDWKQRVAKGGFLELQRFAKGLERDQEAVLAGLSQSYSNGMTEGFVNKLKLIKRQSYGRASFPLLRQRVLHAL
jgi:transposase